MDPKHDSSAPNEREIFTKALELGAESEIKAYLEEVCQGQPELRERIESLLKAEQNASSFLENSPRELSLTLIADDVDFAEDGQKLHFDFLTPSEKPGCLGTIGEYEIVGVVGRGAFGIVFRAFDRKLNRVVAIKVMAPELALNPMAVKRFSREAQAAAAVTHDHVITLHAIDETSKPPLIVMEYVEGESLDKRVDREGALETVEILRIGMQIASGLGSAHRLGMIHRDIKPANILLAKGSQRVKITDFGLARAVDDIGMTQTGTIAGTPQYMSPEQGLGQPLDGRTDLFSLGSVLYTLCTGRAPFRADSTVATLKRVCDDEPRKIREVNPDIPSWLCSLVMKLLRKNPQDRFQSAEEVEEVFRSCLAEVQTTESGHQTPKAALTVSNAFLRIGHSAWPLAVAIAVQVLAMLGSFLAALMEIETIVFTGPFFGIGMGTAIAVLAYMHAAKRQYSAFGLSSIAFAVFIFMVILGFNLGPADSTPIMTLIFLYIVFAIPWGIILLQRFPAAILPNAEKPPIANIVRAALVTQLFAMIVTLAFCAWDEEPIVILGPLFGLGMGLAITYFCVLARLPWHFIGFGLFSMAYTLFFGSLIAGDIVRIREEPEVLMLVMGYGCIAFPWGVYLLYDLRRASHLYAVDQAAENHFVVTITLALQIFGVALATAIFSLDSQSIVAVIPLFYVVAGITTSVLVVRNKERHWLTKAFAVSSPITGALVLTVAILAGFDRPGPTQEFGAWVIAAVLDLYCLLAIPLGLWCLAHETKLFGDLSIPKFSIKTGLIGTTLLAIAFAFARPSLNFGPLSFVANALFALAILGLVGQLGYYLYQRADKKLIPFQWLGIGVPTLGIALVYMAGVSAFDQSVNVRPLMIQFKNLPDVLVQPVKLEVKHLGTKETEVIQITNTRQLVGWYRTGELELALVESPGYKLDVKKLRIRQRSAQTVTLSRVNIGTVAR